MANPFNITIETKKKKSNFVRELFEPGRKNIQAVKESIKQKSFKPIGSRLKEQLSQSAEGIKKDPVNFALSFDGGGPKIAGKLREELVVTPIQKLVKAIKSAGKPQKALEQAQKTERAIRASRVEQVFSQGKGQAGYQEALGRLKGELAPRPKFEPVQVVGGGNAMSNLAAEARKHSTVGDFIKSLKSNPDLAFHQTDKLSAKKIYEKGFRTGAELGVGEKKPNIYAFTVRESPNQKLIYVRNGKEGVEIPLNVKGLKIEKQTIADNVTPKVPEGKDGLLVTNTNGKSELLLTKEAANRAKFDPEDFYKQANKVTPEEVITQTDVDDLFNQVQQAKNLDIYEKVGASSALQKLFSGELPQPSQLSLLEDIFGKDLILAIREKRSGWEKFSDFVTELVNIPRSLMTSIDMSAPLRQGVMFTLTKPKTASVAFKEMFKQAFSQKNFEQWLADIPNNPYYRQMKDSKLYIADPTKVSGGLSAKEEKFMTNLAEKIPILGGLVKSSERAYVSYLNKMRVDVFTKTAQQFAEEGVDTPENLRSLANFVNNATGRGNLGSFERVSQQLSHAFFSPRLIASRFNLLLNPVWYAKQTPPVRKEAMKTWARFIGTGSTILMLAKLGGADVETDPRSSDFGKIKVGNTRWDVWGGFQQWVRAFSQVASGERKSTSDDKITELSADQFPYDTRGDVARKFFIGKLAPIPGLANEILNGQKMMGGEITLEDELKSKFIPLYLQDMKDVVDEFGTEGIFYTGVPAFFGVGTQTFETKEPKTERKNGNPFNL